MSAVSIFRKGIAERLKERGLRVSDWRGGTRGSGHLFEVGTKPKPTVLYVKESSTSPGFWGLTKNQLARLDHASVRWFAVLLARSAEAGYVLSGGHVSLRIQDGTFELSADGDHKVNEGSDLVHAQFFGTLDDLIARVL